MANSKRGDRFFRPDKSTQTTIDRNLSICACTCFLKERCDKSTAMVAPAGNDTISQKPLPHPLSVMKKTCTKCNSRRESTGYELEPYVESAIEFYETRGEADIPGSSVLSLSSSSEFEHPPRMASKTGDNPTPEEIMNSWMPGKERLREPLFTPGEKYVDVSPRDFSMRRYFPELFLSETEKQELRDRERKELEDIQQQRDKFCETKCPQGTCNSKNVKDLKIDQYWRTVVDDFAIGVTPTPCPWRDVDMPLAREREEVTDEESRAKVKTNPQRSSKWLRWPCSKKKLGKKSENKRQDEL